MWLFKHVTSGQISEILHSSKFTGIQNIVLSSLQQEQKTIHICITDTLNKNNQTDIQMKIVCSIEAQTC